MKKMLMLIAIVAFISGCSCPFSGCGCTGGRKEPEVSAKKCCGTCAKTPAKKCACATTCRCCCTCK